jgi:hypothetical protein
MKGGRGIYKKYDCMDLVFCEFVSFFLCAFSYLTGFMCCNVKYEEGNEGKGVYSKQASGTCK